MKLTTLLAASALLTSGVSFGAAGIFDELVWVTTITPFDYGTSTFYEIDSDTANLFSASEFQGANLGAFTVGGSLFLSGQQKSFKNGGTDVTQHALFWSLDGGVTNNVLNYPFQADLGGGDQRWGSDATGGLTSNILTGLPNGAYTLTVFTGIITNNVDALPQIFNNRGGQNYNATFTVIPEPSSAALLGLLGTAVLLRRRK